MHATGEMGESGRIVIPKKIRDAMGLDTGVALEFETRDDGVFIRPQRPAKGLWNDRGLWVYDAGLPLTEEDVRRVLEEGRERRSRFILGASLEP